MKSQQQLALKAISSFSNYYIDYKELKKSLYETQRELTSKYLLACTALLSYYTL